MPGKLLCSLELALAAGQQERNTVAELQIELVGFKDRIRVAEGELAKYAPLISQLNHANQNMGNRVSLCLCLCMCMRLRLRQSQCAELALAS